MFENAFLTCYFLSFIVAALCGYLIGCINSSIVVTRLFGVKDDIRSVGSGNAGFTNVLRTMNKRMATLTFVGDFAKGVLAVWLGKLLFCSACSSFGCSSEVIAVYGAYVAGLACVLGHIYPCFFKFKGGKGVLTTWAITLLIDWRVFLIIICVFLITLILSKIVSLSSLIAAVSYPISTFFVSYFCHANHSGTGFFTAISFAIALMVIYKHKDNIKRIIGGTEKKISVHKKSR